MPGFDDLLDGGIPRGSTVVLAGPPGTGKTTFSCQFLHHGATKLQETALYLSFFEDRAKIARNMKAFGIDLEPPEKAGKLRVRTFPDEEFTPTPSLLCGEILKEFEEFKPDRAVIDSLTAISVACPNAPKNDLQSAIQTLFTRLAKMDCTTILIAELQSGSSQLGNGIEELMADGIVVLHYRARGKAKVKAVEVRKMRGTMHTTQGVLLEITPEGIVVDPDIELIA